MSDGRTEPRAVERLVLASSAPVVLPAVSHAQGDEHREAVLHLRSLQERALASLDPDAPVLVIAAGDPIGVHDHTRVDLRPLGHPVAVDGPNVARDLADPLTVAMQLPLLIGAPLGIDATVLVAGLPTGVQAIVAEVPAGAAGGPLLALGAGIVRMADRLGRRLQVVVAGDLSAGLHTGSPAYEIEDAATVQARVVAAVQRGDAEAVAELGPDEAAGAAVRSWAPLCVAAGIAAAARLDTRDLDVAEVRGVGHLVGVLS